MSETLGDILKESGIFTRLVKEEEENKDEKKKDSRKQVEVINIDPASR